jgi:hypothetical protein
MVGPNRNGFVRSTRRELEIALTDYDAVLEVDPLLGD